HLKQKAFIEERCPQVYCKAGTKSGKTTAMIIFCIEFAIELDAKNIHGANIWWIAPTYPVSQIAMNRLWAFIPPQYKPFFKLNKYQRYIEFPKGIKIWFKSGDKPDRLFGEDVYAVVIDEASRVSEDVLEASISVLTATNGLLRCIGNSKGERNWFFFACKEAQEHEQRCLQMGVKPQKKYLEMHTLDNPKIDKKTVELAKSTLSEKRFKELYFNEILQEGDRAYDDELIKRCITTEMSNMPAVAFGVDIGKVTDYTVVLGLDINGNLAYFDRFKGRHLSNQTIAKRILKGLETEHLLLAYVDGTGIYNMIAESVQKKIGSRKCKVVYIGGNNYRITNGRFIRQHELERLAMAMELGYIRF
ncbi:MAG: hypothetical protein NZ519_13990, partial [Bacteroidia bacterium]|nr:hypothetical protein [Bacteroidia bacterium]